MGPDNTFFPLGIAKGKAFCNRIQERKRLTDNIKSGRHSLIVSPRRYGKSSLALYVLNELKLPFSQVDFFVAINESVIEKEIISKVNQLVNLLGTKQEVLFKTLKDFIKKLELKLVVGSDGVNLEITPAEKSDPARNIHAALLLLENFLASKKKKAVIFIDEFQEIGVVAKNKGIEGAIRSVAQESQYLNFIFSGSNRHLLSQMFEDRNRPLYKLCDRLVINRIHLKDYLSFISQYSAKTWGKAIDDELIIFICQTVELHPYYLNLLCGRLWSKFIKKPPVKKSDIESIWHKYILEQKSDVAKELSFLSDLQKKIILNIALGNDSILRGKENLKKFGVSSAAITKALKTLKEEDYIIEFEKNQYKILDPLIKASLELEYGDINKK